jgi:hypothetical protein
MGRAGCFLGCLLMLVAFGVLGAIVVIPTLPGAENNATIMGLLEPVLCESGETLSQDTSVYTDTRGTTRSPHYYCEGDTTPRREVTDTATLYGVIGFVGPFLIGLLMVIGGAIWMARRATQTMTSQILTPSIPGGSYQPAADGSFTVNAGGVPIRIQTSGQTARPGVGGVIQAQPNASTAAKLQELQSLLGQGLISQEEYNKLRQEILDDSF